MGYHKEEKEKEKEKEMKVAAPKGYHWMKSGKSYKLMKDPKRWLQST